MAGGILHAEPGHFAYPEDNDTPMDGPTQLGALALRLAAVRQGLTTAQRDALTGTDLWTGRRIWNTTTQRVEVYNGSSWGPVGVTDHNALSNLTTGDPHTQYTRKALLTAKGDLYAASAAGVVTRQAVGADGRVLTADSAAPTGLAWTDLSGTFLTKAAVAGYRETLVTLGTSGTATLDFAVSNAWFINPTGAVTIVFSNFPAAGTVAPGTLIVANSSHAITWPAGTKFPGGSAPALEGETFLSLVARSTHVTVGTAWEGVA
jgi:hypothetical protein